MRASEAATELCQVLVRRTVERDDRSFIVTPFRYADGDFINAYLIHEEDEPAFSDMGATEYRLRGAGVEETEARSELLARIVALHGVERSGMAFIKRSCRERIGVDFIAFCSALTRISNLEFTDLHRIVSPIPVALEGVLAQHVSPSGRGIVKHWTDQEADPNRDWPVDFHINTKGEPRNLFAVTSRDKATFVAGACNLFRLKARYVPTMAVVDPESEVGGRPLRQLQSAVDEICFGIDKQEQRIAEFALAARF